jgi:hypothetical protein
MYLKKLSWAGAGAAIRNFDSTEPEPKEIFSDMDLDPDPW